MGSRCAVFFFSSSLIAAFALSPAPAAGADGVAGEWEIRFEAGGQTLEYYLELSQSGEKVKGDLVSPRSKRRYPIEDGTFKDSTLKFKVPEKKAELVATLTDGRLEGTFGTAEARGRLEGKPRSSAAKETSGKKPSLTGKWRTTATLPDGREVAGTLEIADREGKLSGKLAGERGSLDLKSVSITGDGNVAISFILPANSGDREVSLRAAFDGPDRMKGRWSIAGGSDEGEWSARRETPPAERALKERYQVEARLPDGNSMSLAFRAVAVSGKLSGAMVLEGGEKVRVQGTFKEGRIEFECDFPYQGDIRRVTVTGELDEKGVIQGSWRTDEASGEWIARPAVEI